MLTTSTRPKRADARRNYDRLVKAATEAFVAHGTEASLDDIARAAGVGSGTLYRHFPTRDALVAAVIEDSLEGLQARGAELAEHDDPADAMRLWLRALLDHVGSFRGLAANMCQATDDSDLRQSCTMISGTTEALLTRAQTAGALRADVRAEDLTRLANGIALAAEPAPDCSATADRLLALALDGMRAR